MNTRTIAGWAVFAIIVGFIIYQLPSAPGLFYFIQAKQQRRAGNHQAALESYQKVTSLDPDFSRGHVEMGETLLMLERYTEAANSFETALSVKQDSCAACGLGMAYNLSNRVDEAEKAFQRAIQLDPNDVCAYDQAGRMYYDSHKYQQAIESLGKAVKLKPRASTYHFLGNAYRNLENYEQAVSAYKEIFRINPKYSRAHADLGATLFKLQRYQESVAAYEKAIEMEPEDPKGYLGMGLAQLALGNKAKALEQYRALQTLNEKWASWLLSEINKDVPLSDKS